MAYSQMPKRKQQAETAVAEPLRRESLFKPKIKALRWWMMLLIMLGSLWIMSHLNQNMIPMERIMQMQR